MITFYKAAKAARLNREGHTWEALAIRYGCSERLLRAAVAENKRRRKIAQLVANEKSTIRKLAAEGETLHAIAAAFGMKADKVRHILKYQPKGAAKPE